MFEFVAAHPILAFLALSFVSTGVFVECERRLLPLRIPKSEIQALASDLVNNFGSNAAETVLIWMDRAAHRMEYFEEGKWRRVYTEIKRIESST